MAPPIFTLPSRSGSQKKSQVHLLPCRIHHDGEVGPAKSYWNPIEGEGETPFSSHFPQLSTSRLWAISDGRTDGQKTAYFRGRKLHGKTMRLPAGYHGAVVEKGEPKPVRGDTGGDAEASDEAEVQGDQEELLEVGAMCRKTTFDKIVVWGHEAVAESSADPYVRGVEEWISFAEQVSSVYLPLPCILCFSPESR